MTDRAQLGQPRPWVRFGLTAVFFLAVVTVVGDAALDAQRKAMSECAPDCHVGTSPSLIESVIANPLSFVGAGAAVATLGIFIIALDRAGIVPTWLGGERDE